MLIKAGMFLAAPFLIFAAVLGATGVVVVDVQDGGPDGTHIVVPVPLLLAQAALTFVPNECKYVEVPEAADYVPIAETVVRELRKQPDFVLAEVEDEDETVLIRKVGDELQVDVQSRSGEEVSCRLPLEGAVSVLRSYDGRGFPAKAAVSALRHASRGQIVSVRDGEETVILRKL